MAQELTRKSTTLSGGVRSLVSNPPWRGLALAAVLSLSAFLNLFRLTSEGYGNTYYAAAVKNMLTSWHNFFFVSYDAGFVSVDKPPLGLWIQAASAYLFGFSGLSLLVPQALAGVLSVALLYHLVRRTFGPVAGLVAALGLAVTPIAVAVERTNNSDGLLTLTVLVAAWAVIRAAETGRLRWLVVGAAMVGLGFNIKMLEAYLVLPAFYLLYLLASPVSWWRRFVHLGIATVVLLVVSLSWAVVVDLTPADQRPYVGSSSNNSELNLILGWNGLNRLPLHRLPGGEALLTTMGMSHGHSAQPSSGSQASQGSGGPMGERENGAPGPLRLLDEQLAGQIGWLLPLAVVGLLAASWQERPRLPLARRQGALVLWGTWLLTMGVFFSIASFHSYYTVMLAPAVAALVGAGVVALWSDYRSPGRRGWLLPLTLLGVGILHAYIILTYYDEDWGGCWGGWLTLVIAGLCLVATVGLVVLRLRPRLKVSAYSAGAMAVGILALLIAPTVWAAYTVWQGNGRMPAAGPQTVQGSSWGGPGGPPGGPSGIQDTADPALMNYLQANRGGAEYLVATNNARSASPIILSTDESNPVIALAGFGGHDPVFTADELAGLVDKGAVRFFLVGGGPGGSNSESAGWVQDNCEEVPQEEWQSPDAAEQGGGGPPGRDQALYDCATGER